jgi:putative ABC transport system permease protein
VKYLHLIWRNLMRKKLRTTMTVLSIVVAFVLFALLGAIRLAFSMGVDIIGADRLIMIHKVSIIQLLPISYLEQLRRTDGVVDATHATWFGAIYQEPKNFFPQFPVDPEAYLRLYPEIVVQDEQKQAWLADRTGAMVGRKTVERFGWKLGDRIPLQAPVWRNKTGGSAWELTIRAIYEGREKGFDETNMFFHYDYFDEARFFGEGLVGWYILRIDDPQRAAEIAERIDAQFANSRYETKTTTEKAFMQAFADQMGNIGAILTAILTAVFFTILLVAGNTMAQSVRERVSEVAVLKTLGFSNRLVLALVLGESVVLAVVGGAVGLALGGALVKALGASGQISNLLAVFYLPSRDVVIGIALAVGLGLVCGTIPALRAMRLRIADGLRRA